MIENIPENEPRNELQAEPQSEPVPKKKTARKVIYYSLIVLFSLVFIASAIYLGIYMLDSGEQSGRYDDLANLVDQLRQDNATRPTRDDGSYIYQPGESIPYDPDSPILPEYQALYLLNSDLVGWISIDGTAIDYPVMQRVAEKDYYLERNFDQQYSRWGCIYVREQCNVFTPSDNVVIYGHYKSDGTMFHDLHGYYRKAFWEEHKFINFDTIYERHKYEIIAVFKTSAILGEGYPYHQFNDAVSEEEFDKFVEKVKSLSFYDTGVDAQYGDMLITLSTCEYTQEEGRLVVVAKRVS